MEAAGASTNIIILDACRDNPWDRAWRGGPRGLAPVYAPKGTIIAYATSPGQTAADGKGRNGAYTNALLQHIDAADVPIEAMFKRVRNTLAANTLQGQISWEHTSLSGEFFFNLGVARRVTEYGASALKDRIFVLDESKFSHQVIKALKSLTWPRQNPAIEELTASNADGASTDSLFVLGRNICQAAEGCSRAAERFIDRFVERTSGMNAKKRKALLDGILFEIFFDSNGGLRDAPKVRSFNRVFDLQKFPELADSFEFIAGCLAPESHRYLAIPGKAHSISVDVTLSDDAENVITGIYTGGRNFLVADPDYFPSPFPRRGQTCVDFERGLAECMLVPLHLLNFTYSKPLGQFDRIKFQGHKFGKVA
jgi:Caspase domain